MQVASLSTALTRGKPIVFDRVKEESTLCYSWLHETKLLGTIIGGTEQSVVFIQDKNTNLSDSLRELSNNLGQLQAREQELLTKIKLKVETLS